MPTWSLREMTEDGLVLIDGHLRADLHPDSEIPVAIVDLDESEAGELLATLDPIAAMAESDHEALDRLLATVEGEDAAMDALLQDVRDTMGLSEVELAEQEPEEIPEGIKLDTKESTICPNCQYEFVSSK